MHSDVYTEELARSTNEPPKMLEITPTFGLGKLIQKTREKASNDTTNTHTQGKISQDTLKQIMML